MTTLLQDDFSKHSGDKLTIISNASVNLNNNTASGAWQLHTTRDKKRRASQSLERQTYSHSYRHELETFHPALKDTAEVLTKPHNITQYMDYEAVLTALARPSYKSSHNMVTDADLIMARAQLKYIIPHTVTEE